MTKQERNQVFLDSFIKLMADQDAKMICCLGLTADGKTVAVMDMHNTVGEILGAVKSFVKGLDEMAQTPDHE